MKIKSLEIDGVGGIGHLEVSFGYGMNVICGANGIGKTTILDIISEIHCMRLENIKFN